MRYIGVTHYTASAYPEVERVLLREKLDFLQVNYSLAEREAESRILPLAREKGVAVLVNRPFGGGEALKRVLSTAAARVGRGVRLHVVAAVLPEVDSREPGRHVRDSRDQQARAPRRRSRRGARTPAGREAQAPDGRRALTAGRRAVSARGVLPLLHLLEALRPVAVEKAREGPVREELAARLARRAVVRLVVCVDDALDFRPAGGARLAVLAVHGHLRPEGGHLLGELLAGVPAQPLRPVEKRLLRRVVKAGDLRVGEPRRERDGGELRRVEDLVGVRVSDAGEERRIRQGAFQRVVLAPQARGRRPRASPRAARGRRDRARRAPRVPATTRTHARFFGLASVRRSRVPDRNPGRGGRSSLEWGLRRLAPLQSARDHEMKNEEEILLRRKIRGAFRAGTPPRARGPRGLGAAARPTAGRTGSRAGPFSAPHPSRGGRGARRRRSRPAARAFEGE